MRLPAVLTGFSFNDNSYSNNWTPASNGLNSLTLS